VLTGAALTGNSPHQRKHGQRSPQKQVKDCQDAPNDPDNYAQSGKPDAAFGTIYVRGQFETLVLVDLTRVTNPARGRRAP
jgi:hypothetical protein